MDFEIRQGDKKDLGQVMDLIRELAVFEKAGDQVLIDENTLLKDGFSNTPRFDFLVACKEDTVLGMALFYYKYSTWQGTSLYLEDLIVAQSARNQGIGTALLKSLVTKAKKEDLARLEWQVLDWNTDAIRFYERMGAEFDEEWTTCRLYKNNYNLHA